MGRVFDELWSGVANGMTDIRQKVVEEPMWGRTLGENDLPTWPEAHEPEPSFGSSTHIREMEPEPGRSFEQDREHCQELDFDR